MNKTQISWLIVLIVMVAGMLVGCSEPSTTIQPDQTKKIREKKEKEG